MIYPRALSLFILLGASACAGRVHMPGYIHTVEERTLSFESQGHTVRVNAYVPEGKGQRHPAALVLHGSGGIHFPLTESSERYAEALANRGVAAYVVYYFDATGTFTANLATEAREYWRWVRVVRDAVSWVRARPEVRPAQVGLFGVSLGAYVAVGAAATDQRISRMVIVSGGLEPGVADSARHLPPTLLLHGTADDVVTLVEEDTLVHLLTHRKTLFFAHHYPGEGHDFSPTVAVDAVERSARFLSEGRIGTLLEYLRRSETRVPTRDTTRTRIP